MKKILAMAFAFIILGAIGIATIGNEAEATHVAGSLIQHNMTFCEVGNSESVDCVIKWEQNFPLWSGYTAVCTPESFYGEQKDIHVSIKQKYADRMIVQVDNNDPIFIHSTRLNCIGIW